jgi:NAD(P)-dependent dehydrogenase (short-subunit alcohol dehydrogenase family)
MNTETQREPAFKSRRLTGTVAVVTGSSTGNGRAIALRLAGEGAHVVCSDVRKGTNPEGYDDRPEIDTDELIREYGGESVYVAADVAQEADVQALADRAVSVFGRVDTWVNNAGIGDFADIKDMTLGAFSRVIDTNLTGTWLGCRAAVRVMLAQEQRGRSKGRIINIGSLAGEMGQGGLSAYAASKGAVGALTRELAIELGPEHVNVNAILPGYMATAMTRVPLSMPSLAEKYHAYTALPELGTAWDVAAAAAFFASDDAVFVTGVLLPIDGGVLAGKYVH